MFELWSIKQYVWMEHNVPVFFMQQSINLNGQGHICPLVFDLQSQVTYSTM